MSNEEKTSKKLRIDKEKKEPVQLPICYRCGKTPLRCGQPGDCKMENL